MIEFEKKMIMNVSISFLNWIRIIFWNEFDLNEIEIEIEIEIDLDDINGFFLKKKERKQNNWK